MQDFWKKTEEKLIAGDSCYLLVVVQSHGSSPGKAGFKMLVCENEVLGSVGGGTMEYNMIREVRKYLKEGRMNIRLKKQEHKSSAPEAKSGLICSGVQWVAYYPLQKNDELLIREIIKMEKEESAKAVLFTETGWQIGEKKERFVEEKRWLFTEQPGKKNTLYIFGGGHVSLALSRLMKTLDFKVKVYDNRKDVSTMEENVFADEKKVIDYQEAGSIVPDGDHVYVAVMTFAHKQDYTVIRQMLGKKIKYLGMMGSEQKVASIFGMLKEKDGVNEQVLREIDAPIGMEIGSETPNEIAVSIAAKIVSVKNAG